MFATGNHFQYIDLIKNRDVTRFHGLKIQSRIKITNKWFPRPFKSWRFKRIRVNTAMIRNSCQNVMHCNPLILFSNTLQLFCFAPVVSPIGIMIIKSVGIPQIIDNKGHSIIEYLTIIHVEVS